MSTLNYCFSCAIVFVAVGTVWASSASLPTAATIHQDLQKIADTIQELTETIAESQNSQSVLKVAEVLRSQQTTLGQLLSGNADKSSQCQPNYELAIHLGGLKAEVAQVSQALGPAGERMSQLEEGMHEVEATSSQALNISRTNKERLQSLLEEEATRKGHCRSPFYKVGVDCVYVDLALQRTWIECRTLCRAFGGDLIVPSDIAELREFLAAVNKGWNFWIGGSDLNKEGVWLWLDGSRVDLTIGWEINQPSGGEEDCLHYWEKHNLLFNDARCSHGMRCVCQQDASYADVG